jgi:hypothetical protein
MRRQQSRRGLGSNGGLAFVSHAGAVLSGRHPSGIETENSREGIPSPTSESYLPNLAILLDASRTGRVAPWLRGKTGSIAGIIAKLPELVRRT